MEASQKIKTDGQGADPVWRWKPFVYCLVAVAVFSATFFPPGMQDVWAPADKAFFLLLNGTLASEGPWRTIVAWANTRIFDNLWAVVMGLLCLWVLFSPRYGDFNDRFTKIFAITLTVALSVILAKLGFRHYDRMSPGMVFENLDEFNNLNILMPLIKAKVSSFSSFPGDHSIASVVFATTFACFYRARRHLVVAAVLIAIVNVLPRLIGGGHWLSDAVIGGGLAGLVVLPILIGTPYLRWLRRLTGPIVNRLVRPLLGKAGLDNILR